MLTRAERRSRSITTEPEFLLTTAEKQFKWLMGLWAITFAAGAAAALTPISWVLVFAAHIPWLAKHQQELSQLYGNPVLAVATAAGELQLALFAWMIAWGVRRNNALAWLIVVGKVVFITGFSLFLIADGWPPFIHSLLISALAFDVIQLVTTVVFRQRAVHSRA